MINDMALKLATKDFISSGVLRWHLIGIRQAPVDPLPPSHGDYETDIPEAKRRHLVEVTFEYDNKIYTQTKYIDQNVMVTADMIEIETIDNEPIVKITI